MTTSDLSRRKSRGLAVGAAAVVAMAVVLAPVSARALDQPRTGSAQLQRDVDAIRSTGATAVLAEVKTPSSRSAARSGVADLKTRRPVPWNSHYRIGSTTKTFVSTVALQLVGEGRLKLTDTVQQRLPGLVKGKKVTVRQLLGHTSGLPDYTTPMEQATTPEAFHREQFRTYRPEQLVAMAMRDKRTFAPGKGWSYSNTNYILVGMIIERVTGNPWQQEVHERIIQPLGLRNTFTPGTSAYLPHPRATTYKRLRPGGPLVDVSNYAAGHADASIISTTADVNRFFGALLSGRLLQPEQLKQMQTTVPAKPFQAFWQDPGYGLGLMKRRLPCGGWVWFHGGGNWNTIADNGVTPDGRRSVAVSYSTSLEPGQSPLQQAKASAALIDHALCSTQ